MQTFKIKTNIFLLLLFSSICNSQSQSVEQIADMYLDKILFNQNVRINSDHIITDLLFTSTGFCYKIERNYIGTTADDIEIIKQKVTKSNKWFSDQKGKNICELIQGNYKYSIYYNTTNYYEKGLTLSVSILNELPISYGYKVKGSTNLYDLSAFKTESFYIERQKELLENYSKQKILTQPLEKIVDGLNAFVGEILCDYNIIIEDDLITAEILTTESGFCYKVKTRFKGTKIKDLEQIKNKVKTTNLWKLNNDTNIPDITTVTEGNITHTISGSNLNPENFDLILSSEINNIDANEGEKSYDYERLDALEAFYISQGIIARQKVLLDKDIRMKTTLVEEINLPYKLKFGWNESEIETHLKSILPTDTIAINCNFNYDFSQFQESYDDREIKILDSIMQENGIYEMKIQINQNSDSSLFIGILFLNNKAYSYTYGFGYNQQSNLESLKSKIYEIKNLHKTTAVKLDGQTIKLRKNENDIENLFSEAINEFNKKEKLKQNTIGNKM